MFVHTKTFHFYGTPNVLLTHRKCYKFDLNLICWRLNSDAVRMKRQWLSPLKLTATSPDHRFDAHFIGQVNWITKNESKLKLKDPKWINGMLSFWMAAKPSQKYSNWMFSCELVHSGWQQRWLWTSRWDSFQIIHSYFKHSYAKHHLL